jgi:hypothetical protein
MAFTTLHRLLRLPVHVAVCVGNSVRALFVPCGSVAEVGIFFTVYLFNRYIESN